MRLQWRHARGEQFGWRYSSSDPPPPAEDSAGGDEEATLYSAKHSIETHNSWRRRGGVRVLGAPERRASAGRQPLGRRRAAGKRPSRWPAARASTTSALAGVPGAALAGAAWARSMGEGCVRTWELETCRQISARPVHTLGRCAPPGAAAAASTQAGEQKLRTWSATFDEEHEQDVTSSS